jgi:hypothetical protein
VHVKIAADVSAGHRRGQSAGERHLYCLAVISKFRGDEREPERGVNVLLGRRDEMPTLDRSQPLRIERQASIGRETPESIEVGLAAGQLQE